MDVLRPGCTVTVGGDIQAKVVAICIYPNCRVTYQCSWFDGRTYHEKWLDGFQITVSNQERFNIGFVTTVPAAEREGEGEK